MTKRQDRAPKEAPSGDDMFRWWPLILFSLALATAFWRAPTAAPAVFAESTASVPTSIPADFFSEKLTEPQGQVGSSSIARLPDGRLVIVWQESRTGDVSETQLRLLAQNRQGQWLPAQTIANRPTVAAANFAYLNHLDNPLLYAEGNWLHLYFVSHALSDWRSATLIHSFSSDAGQNWSPQRKIHIAPGLNSGTLRLAPPIPLNEGELALPLQEGDPGRPSWLRLSATGQAMEKTRLSADQVLLPQGIAAVNQPAGSEFVLALSATHLLAAGNPQGDRKQLVLWQSTDAGQNWDKGRVIEQAEDGAAEFTHPFLLLTADGRIHLTYSWRQQTIKHLHFRSAWLDEANKP